LVENSRSYDLSLGAKNIGVQGRRSAGASAGDQIGENRTFCSLSLSPK
jgi:hypothetical protein